MKVQLGTGDVFLDGYINTDVPEVDLRAPLPYMDESVDIVVAAHVLEILLFREVPFAMKEIGRILKVGGWARFHFGSEKLALTTGKLIETLLFFAVGRWEVYHLDKENTLTGDPNILAAKGQHGPSIVIEMRKL